MVSKERLEKMIEDCSHNNKYNLGFRPGLNAQKLKDPFIPQQLLKYFICPYLNPNTVQNGVDCEYAQLIPNTKYYRCNARR